MGSEYVRISISEGYYAQKNLLHSQLELLDLIKRVRNYKLLRNQEALLKIVLKQKTKEMSEILESMNRMLPAVQFKEEYMPKREEDKKKLKREKTYFLLQEEIEEIQGKLAALQEGM